MSCHEQCFAEAPNSHRENIRSISWQQLYIQSDIRYSLTMGPKWQLQWRPAVIYKVGLQISSKCGSQLGEGYHFKNWLIRRMKIEGLSKRMCSQTPLERGPTLADDFELMEKSSDIYSNAWYIQNENTYSDINDEKYGRYICHLWPGKYFCWINSNQWSNTGRLIPTTHSKVAIFSLVTSVNSNWNGWCLTKWQSR